MFFMTPNVEMNGLRGFSRRSARLQGYASLSFGAHAFHEQGN
jgi:hypothetical protein